MEVASVAVRIAFSTEQVTDKERSTNVRVTDV